MVIFIFLVFRDVHVCVRGGDGSSVDESVIDLT